MVIFILLTSMSEYELICSSKYIGTGSPGVKGGGGAAMRYPWGRESMEHETYGIQN